MCDRYRPPLVSLWLLSRNLALSALEDLHGANGGNLARSAGAAEGAHSGQSGTMDDRTFGAYLRTLRSGPGLGIRLGAAATFALVLAFTKGVRTLALVLLGVVVLAALVIYPIFRWHGPGPFRRGDP